MKLIFSYDTENKSLTCIDSEGNVIDNISHLSLYKYNDGYDFSMTKQYQEDGMTETETMSCSASVEDKVKTFFKK
jgi:hypothetical protein